MILTNLSGNSGLLRIVKKIKAETLYILNFPGPRNKKMYSKIADVKCKMRLVFPNYFDVIISYRNYAATNYMARDMAHRRAPNHLRTVQ